MSPPTSRILQAPEEPDMALQYALANVGSQVLVMAFDLDVAFDRIEARILGWDLGDRVIERRRHVIKFDNQARLYGRTPKPEGIRGMLPHFIWIDEGDDLPDWVKLGCVEIIRLEG